MIEVYLERIAGFHDSWNGKKRLELLSATARSAARATTTVGCRKSLVKVQVNHVNAHVAWTSYTNQRVHVGAVHVDQPTCIMNNRADFLDVLFKQTERVWIREHQSRDVTAATKLAQVIEIREAFGCRSDRFH